MDVVDPDGKEDTLIEEAKALYEQALEVGEGRTNARREMPGGKGLYTYHLGPEETAAASADRQLRNSASSAARPSETEDIVIHLDENGSPIFAHDSRPADEPDEGYVIATRRILGGSVPVSVGPKHDGIPENSPYWELGNTKEVGDAQSDIEEQNEDIYRSTHSEVVQGAEELEDVFIEEVATGGLSGPVPFRKPRRSRPRRPPPPSPNPRRVKIGQKFKERVKHSARRHGTTRSGGGQRDQSEAVRKLQERQNDARKTGLFDGIDLGDADTLVDSVLEDAITQQSGRLRLEGYQGDRGIAFFNSAGQGIVVRQSDALFITFLESTRGLHGIFY